MKSAWLNSTDNVGKLDARKKNHKLHKIIIVVNHTSMMIEIYYIEVCMYKKN